jgi:hypothetical protein
MAVLEIVHATAPCPGAVNEDVVLTGPAFVAVLDGATAPGASTGCVHSVTWCVHHLSARLSVKLLTGESDLREVLREAISELVADHRGSCDLSNPDSPSSTVSMVRARGNTWRSSSLPTRRWPYDGETGQCR